MSRVAVVATLALLLAPARSHALFHVAHISEVMSGVNGDPTIQYVEIRMEIGFQNVTGQTRLTAFNCDGTTATVLLLVPSNVPNQGAGVHWIMASPSAAAFLAASGITPDFTWDPNVTGNIPTTCGMMCWGAPGVVPPNPMSWSATDPNQYVDCVAYGPYTGPRKTSTQSGTSTSGTPTSLAPGGGTLSLTRITSTGDNAADFALDCPTPTNNTGQTGTFGPCTLPRCGNDTLEPGEDCDPPGSITCPPGSPAGAFFGCSVACRCLTCGNEQVEPDLGETCDPPGSLNPATGQQCRADCTVCGDGIVQTQDGETCDDGNGVSDCDPKHILVPLDDCRNDCRPPICEDPARIILRTPVNSLDVHGRIKPVDGVTIDFAAKPFVVAVTNSDGLVYRAEVPAGAITGKLGRFKYTSKTARVTTGVGRLIVTRNLDAYRVTVRAYGDLSGAGGKMTTHFFVGAHEWTVTGTWLPTSSGYRLDASSTFGAQQ